MNGIDRLISIVGASLIDAKPTASPSCTSRFGQVGEELHDLLRRRNGFYAFVSALHVYPSGDDGSMLSLERWNDPALWTSEYGDTLADCLCFGQDVFGVQFCLRRSRVWSFNPETEEFTALATSLEEWAGLIINDRDYLTGYPLAQSWQERNGPLLPGYRLFPIVPFVLGGQYAIDNLMAGDAVQVMRLYASVARQIRGLPDGTTVDLKWKE